MGRDISEGLVRLVDWLQEGELSAEDFQVKCLEGLYRMDPFFDGLEAKLAGDPPAWMADAWHERQEQRARELRTVRALLRSGVREIAAWPEDGDAVHVEEGLLLVEQGEDLLERLQRDLERDAEFPLSRLNLGGDLLGTLAEHLAAGTLPRSEYQKILEDYVSETSRYTAEGQKAFLEALTYLRAFDGQATEVLGAAADFLERASNEWLSAAANAREQ